MRGTLALSLLVTLPFGCRSDLDRLERDAAIYKLEYERMRLEELEEAHRVARERADALSRNLLELGRERDRLYEEYDRLLGERNSLQRRIEALRAEIEILRRRTGAAEAELDRNE